MIPRICEWIVLVLMALGAVTILGEGLIEKDVSAKTRGPADVLCGCIALVVIFTAAWGVWTR